MKVILKENIDNLGRRGEIVDVARGYGRNYLIPRKLALEVTPSNMKMVEMEQQAQKKKFEKEKQSFQGVIEKMNQTTLTFARKAGEKDSIFGSVSAADIQDSLAGLGFEVEKKRILLDEPIKKLGNYSVPIKVFHDERAEIKVEVVKEGGEEEPIGKKKGKERAETVAPDAPAGEEAEAETRPETPKIEAAAEVIVEEKTKEEENLDQ